MRLMCLCQAIANPLFYTGLLFIFFTASAESKNKLTPVSVELKWFHQFQFAGIYAAKEKGFYAESGLDVQIIRRNPNSNPIKDVVSGKVDFGVSDATLVREFLLGKPVVLLAAIFQHSPLALISLEKNKILGPMELKGKKVMYQKNVDDAIIVGMLAEVGMAEKDFTFVPHSFKEDALVTDSRNVEVMSAYLSNQPYWYEEKGIKLNIIKPQNYGVDFYGDLIFTSKNYFEQNEKTVLAFRKATLKGWEYALKHPEEVMKWLVEKYPSGKSSSALNYEAEVVKRMVAADYVDLGYVSKSRLENIARFYQKTDSNIARNDVMGLYFRDYDLSAFFYHKIFLAVLGFIFFLLLAVALMAIFNKKLRAKISERTREIELKQKEISRNMGIINQHVPLIELSVSGEIKHISDAMLSFCKREPADFIGKKFLNMDCVQFLKSSDRKMFSKALSEESSFQGELLLKMSSKESHTMTYTLSPRSRNGALSCGMVLILNDITDKKAIEALSVTDTLTQLANRYKLNEEIERALKQALRHHQPFSLLLLDLDYFKSVNDTYGHTIGDAVLMEVAQLLKKYSRETDLCGRWGGEEFLLLLSQTNLAEGRVLAEKLRQQMDAQVLVNGIHLTFSIGLTTYQVGDTEKTLIERADRALYQAKQQGRNQVVGA